MDAACAAQTKRRHVASKSNAPSKVTCIDLRLQALRQEEGWFVRVLLHPPINDELASVEADVIGKVERSHRMTCTELHAHINIPHRRIGSIDHCHRLHQGGDEETIHDKSRRISARNFEAKTQRVRDLKKQYDIKSESATPDTLHETFKLTRDCEENEMIMKYGR